MEYLLVIYFLINGVWVAGDDYAEGWSALPYPTLEQCQASAARGLELHEGLKIVNPQAHDKRFECEPRAPRCSPTIAATEKLEAIKREFQDWIWTGADRRTEIARIYNDTFNTNVERSFDASTSGRRETECKQPAQCEHRTGSRALA